MHLLDRRLSYHLVFFKSHVIQPSRAESIAERKDSSRRHTNLDTLVVAGARTSPMPPQHAYTLGMYYRDSTYTHELSLSLSHPWFIHLRCAQRGVLLHASVRLRRRRAPLPVPFADDNGGEPPRTSHAFAYTPVRQRRRPRYPECSAASPTFTNVADQKQRALTAVPASVYVRDRDLHDEA